MAKNAEVKPKLEYATKALDKLVQSMEPSTTEQLDALWRGVDVKREDRGTAILFALSVENALDVAIGAGLRLTGGHLRHLLTGGGILSSFHAKIEAGKALGIYGNETYGNLNIIRRIRNAFAHAKSPLSFVTPEVEAVCSFLTLPTERHRPLGRLRPHAADFKPVGQKRYQTVCEDIFFNLKWWAVRGLRAIAEDRIVGSQAGYNLFARAIPLL